LVLVVLLVAGAFSAAPTGAQTKITMLFPSWQWGQPGYDDFFRRAIAEFEKRQPNVSIQPVPIPLESYADQLIVRFSAKNPPEIVQWTLWDFHTFAEAGFLDPLDDRLKETDILQTWVPAFLKFTQVKGKQYGVMLSGASVALMYNKRMFREAGLEVPSTPREFVEAAKKLTLRDNTGRVTQYGLAMVSKPVPELVSYGIGRMITDLGGSLSRGGRPAVNSRAIRS